MSIFFDFMTHKIYSDDTFSLIAAISAAIVFVVSCIVPLLYQVIAEIFIFIEKPRVRPRSMIGILYNVPEGGTLGDGDIMIWLFVSIAIWFGVIGIAFAIQFWNFTSIVILLAGVLCGLRYIRQKIKNYEHYLDFAQRVIEESNMPQNN